MKSKPAELSAGLVAVKGKAAPAIDMPPRAAPAAPPASPVSETTAEKGRAEELVPLNFKLPASFQKAFKVYAATHGMKLNELLKVSFESYRKQQGD